MVTNSTKEPGEIKDNTIDVEAKVIDPVLEAKTVNREYSTGFKSAPNSAPIPEPDIQQPNFDEPSSTVEDDTYTEEPSNRSNTKAPNDDDDTDDFGFELNGETAIYIIDFLYNLLKNQYKITEETLEKYGLDKATFQARIIVDNINMTVAQYAESINEMMDSEVTISPKDKNAIKKIITRISKKHNVKMSDEAQLFVIGGKIYFETHLQLKALQAIVINQIVTATPGYAAQKQAEANAQEPVDPATVQQDIKADKSKDNTITVEEVTRGKGGRKKNGANNKASTNAIVTLEAFVEPGEKKYGQDQGK